MGLELDNTQQTQFSQRNETKATDTTTCCLQTIKDHSTDKRHSAKHFLLQHEYYRQVCIQGNLQMKFTDHAT